MSLQENFDKAVENVKVLKSTPSDADLLEIYGLYKQATVGDCNTEKPGLLDFKGKSKWEAWNKRKDTPQEAAKQAYVDKVQQLIEKHGL
ncbi:acyl-CoA-binding protein [Anopheles cruzii]|uniref:acyl-CoA-binding protein n=1 Tax=Anopheles cruzii TaxID=68878 RepID=UPI0022EC4653|nr:acyl-CoA-binding protein [Anopheles cruzii]